MHGGVFGLGVEVALACDIRLMSEDCTWGLPEAQFGLIADLGGTARLAKLLGPPRAMEILMTTNRYPAQRALEWGLGLFGDAHKIITFCPFISSNCIALAIFSPRFTEMLTDGCETPSFFDSSVVLIPNLLTAQ
ncbi:MAG: enoyl-CoA hydratase/isomerase family protein [bacterium]|nr:enoyl-CoA hydratase/isomerase family protein [bacterium]